ncbi:MAG: alpha/beta fold hydrolase [Actinomycetota bacterium]
MFNAGASSISSSALARTVAALVATAALVASCSSSDGDSSTASSAATNASSTTDSPATTNPTTSAPTEPESSLAWEACDDPSALDPALECTTLTVPLDYTDPEGDTIDLALIRVPASGTREGAVLTNPGGPGGSGFEFVANAASTIQLTLGLEGFDIVGFDPRGVDRSGGLRCLNDAELDATAYLDPTPETPEEQAALDESSTAFVTGCTTKFGDTLRHYSTDNTARDMDSIRAAMGDEQISYLGISYGTYLGGVYATLFPDRVRAMVLDSAYAPEGDSVEQQYSTQLVGFEEAFDDWAAWCETTPDECSFSSTDVGAAWDALLVQLDESPVAHTDGRQANLAVMGTATVAALYSRATWPQLALAFSTVQEGDATALFTLADGYIGRNPDGTYSTQQQSQSIIDCASGFENTPPDDPEALLARLKELAPRFTRFLTVDDLVGDGTGSCDTLMPSVEPTEVAYTGEAPIVVVGGTNDPATPIRWAEELTAAMGPNARLVTYTGEGHGFVLAATCVNEVEGAVLASLELPDAGAQCDPDPEVERPDWWNTIVTPAGVSDPIDSPALLAALGLGPSIAFGEVRDTELDVDTVLDAYDDTLTTAGFTLSERQTPAGFTQAIYNLGDESFAILALSPEDLAAPELSPLAGLVNPDRTLLVLISVPT